MGAGFDFDGLEGAVGVGPQATNSTAMAHQRTPGGYTDRVKPKWRGLVVDGVPVQVWLQVRYLDGGPEYRATVRSERGDVVVCLDGWSSAALRLARRDDDSTGFVAVRSSLSTDAPLTAAVRFARMAPPDS